MTDFNFSLFDPRFQRIGYTFIIAMFCGIIMTVGFYFLKKRLMDGESTQTNLLITLPLILVGFIFFIAIFWRGLGQRCRTGFTSPRHNEYTKSNNNNNNNDNNSNDSSQ